MRDRNKPARELQLSFQKSGSAIYFEETTSFGKLFSVVAVYDILLTAIPQLPIHL